MVLFGGVSIRRIIAFSGLYRSPRFCGNCLAGENKPGNCEVQLPGQKDALITRRYKEGICGVDASNFRALGCQIPASNMSAL